MKSDFQLPINFHQGKTIMSTARTYPSLVRVLAEVVQNAVDGGASRIEIDVNIKTRMFRVLDNGSGCGKEQFQQALLSLNSSTKSKDKYGQFGRGLVAPLSVAECFDFTSCATPLLSRYFRYRFVAKDIEPQPQVSIPGYEIDDIKLDPTGVEPKSVWWRTAVEAERLTKDHKLTSMTIESLVEELAKFGEAIRKRKIDILASLIQANGERFSQKVVAPEFNGEPIDVVTVEGPAAGKVTFELFVAKLTRSGRKGSVFFGTFDNPSVISAKQFAACTRGMLDSEVSKALMSGIFEGKVFCKKVELDPDRERFRENDSLVDLCVLINEWYKTVGSEIVSEARDRDSDDRFERIGKSVMPFAELMLRQREFEMVAQGITIGTTGNGHFKVPPRNVIGPDNGVATAVVPSVLERVRARKKANGEKKTPPSKEHPEHHPATIYGTGGHRRTEVKGSTGLRFAFEEMVDTKIPFTYDRERGTLTFNLDHPDWSKCEDSDTTLAKYQQAVVTQAFTLELYKAGKDVVHPDIVDFAYQTLSHNAFAIVYGESMLAKK